MNINRIFAFAAAMLVGVGVLAQEGPVKLVRVGGAFNFGYNPGYPGVEGTGTRQGDILSYEPVTLQQSVSYQVYLAGSYYFRIPAIPAVRPSLGIRLGADSHNFGFLGAPKIKVGFMF